MKCKGPKCTRDVYSRNLCQSHYQQQRRGVDLAPLRLDPARVRLSVRVSEAAYKAAREDYDGAVEALEKWAARK